MTKEEYEEILVLVQEMREVVVKMFEGMGDKARAAELEKVEKATPENRPYDPNRAEKMAQHQVVILGNFMRKYYLIYTGEEPEEPQDNGRAWNLITAINALELIVNGLRIKTKLLHPKQLKTTLLPQGANIDKIIKALQVCRFNMGIQMRFKIYKSSRNVDMLIIKP